MEQSRDSIISFSVEFGKL